MIYLAVFVIIFLVARTLVAMVNNLFPVHLPVDLPENFPKVSVLIPARNEEEHIGDILDDLASVDYPELEIIVCNDHSEDRTGIILGEMCKKSERFFSFESEPLPDGWIGKNFACYQLAQKATGSCLLFLDADVSIDRETIKKAVAFLQKKKLSLLSVFPQLIMKLPGEWFTSPLMHWILVGLLPLPLVRLSSKPSLSAAAGGFMLFEGKGYRENQWHLKVKDRNVEDISIAREIKSKGLKMATLLGNRDFYARMYEGFSNSINGFSKNIHQYFGGNALTMILFWLIVTTGPFLCLLVFGWGGFLLFCLLTIFNRIFISWASRQNVWMNIILHPFQMVSLTLIIIKNISQRTKKQAEWKGRKIQF